jgi:hypothetical protein
MSSPSSTSSLKSQSKDASSSRKRKLPEEETKESKEEAKKETTWAPKVVEAVSELLTCGICLCDFDEKKHVPTLLTSCGHTVCSSCLPKFLDHKCPWCRAAIGTDHIPHPIVQKVVAKWHDRRQPDSLTDLRGCLCCHNHTNCLNRFTLPTYIPVISGKGKDATVVDPGCWSRDTVNNDIKTSPVVDITSRSLVLWLVDDGHPSNYDSCWLRLLPLHLRFHNTSFEQDKCYLCISQLQHDEHSTQKHPLGLSDKIEKRIHFARFLLHEKRVEDRRVIQLCQEIANVPLDGRDTEIKVAELMSTSTFACLGSHAYLYERQIIKRSLYRSFVHILEVVGRLRSQGDYQFWCTMDQLDLIWNALLIHQSPLPFPVIVSVTSLLYCIPRLSGSSWASESMVGPLVDPNTDGADGCVYACVLANTQANLAKCADLLPLAMGDQAYQFFQAIDYNRANIPGWRDYLGDLYGLVWRDMGQFIAKYINTIRVKEGEHYWSL